MRLTIVAIALALVVGLAHPAAAAMGDVVVGGMLILRVRAEAGGMSIEQRAVLVEQRITNALSRGRPSVETITIRTVNAQPGIFVGDILIITVDANHARLNGTTQQALAEIWLRNLREALPKAFPLLAPGVTRPVPSPTPTP
ncbi:MAG TPA: hypothetical protein VGR25_04775 [bacterium]|jgi:hypothetical protein|nr:hypothetical protein [bacterium]